MDPWWWVLIGLAAWILISIVVALLLGPVLRRSSQAREALDKQVGKMPEEPHKPPRDKRQAS